MLVRGYWRVLFVAAVASLAGCGASGESRVTTPSLDTAHDVPAGTGAALNGDADWLSRPSSVKDAAAKADAGVIATVSSVADGEPITAAPDEVSPTQLVTMTVRDRWFGDLKDQFVIRWLGTPHGYLEGDPPYVVGQDYVLFLKRRTDGPWYRPEAPDSRMQILNGRVRPVIEGPVGDDAKQKSPAQVKADAQEATR